jgi:hypothetical protein
MSNENQVQTAKPEAVISRKGKYVPPAIVYEGTISIRAGSPLGLSTGPDLPFDPSAPYK